MILYSIYLVIDQVINRYLIIIFNGGLLGNNYLIIC